MDERYAVIDVAGKGLVIFSAYVLGENSCRYFSTHQHNHSCSHAGIVNVVRDAVSKFHRPIYMVRSDFTSRDNYLSPHK